jgi:hypothetical protein
MQILSAKIHKQILQLICCYVVILRLKGLEVIGLLLWPRVRRAFGPKRLATVDGPTAGQGCHQW